MSSPSAVSARPPAVLLLSGRTGAGHVIAARAVEEELARAGFRVTHLDAYDFVSPLAWWAYTHLHLALLEFVPEFYGLLYERGSRSRALAQLQERLVLRSRNRFAAALRQFHPDVIVVAHALGCALVAPLKGAFGFRLVVLTTDYRAHAFHVHPAVDRYCVSHAWAAADLFAAGVPPDCVTVTGIPLRAQFDAPPTAEEARRQLGLPRDVPVLLVTRGGMAAGRETVELLKALLAEPALQKCVLVAVLGERSRGHRLVARHLGTAPRLRVERFVPNMETYLAAADIVIGKAGGLSSTETFRLARPLIIYAPNEGIETANVARFVAAGAARSAGRSPERAVAAVRDLLEHPERRAALTEAGRALVLTESPRAVRAVVERLVRASVPVPVTPH